MVIIKRHLLLLCLYIEYIIILECIMIVFVYMEQYIIFIKENIMCNDLNRRFNYSIKFKFN
jgi:hypothetical protein